MSQPTVYNRVTSFTTDQAQAPATPLAGANFDAELNGVKTTLDQILTNLAIIQRDDTHLANASVGLDQLDTTVVVGFNLPTAWVTGHAYAVTTDAVFNGVKLYRCAASHTSGTFATDLAAGKWTLLADFTPSIANASNVAFTPAQGIVATNTQAAVVEVKTGVDDITGFRQDISGGYTTAGTSAAYVLTTGTPFVSLAAMNNQPITFIPHATNALNATLAVDGLAAKNIRTATGVNVTAGALPIGTPVQAIYYNGIGEFILTGYTEVFKNVTINGTLGVVGVQVYTAGATFNSTAAFNSTVAFGAAADFAINTNKFTVAAATGNTVIAGTLSVTGKASLTSTDSMAMANGTAAQRNGAPTAGDTRYNSTINGLEYWNGTAWIVLGQAPTVQVLTGSGNYVPTAGVVRARMTLAGGGGGGGGATANNGGNGGTSTLGAWTAIGGSGGVANAGAGGIGGTGGSNGTGTQVFRQNGGKGGAGQATATVNTFVAGGDGGDSILGSGGTGGISGVAASVGPNAGSGGGAGGGNSATASGGGGGAGESVVFWVTNPGTLAFAMGAAGSAGAAGTNAGAAGAAGAAVVEEFYS